MKTAVHSIALFAAAAMKLFYAHAGADQLSVMLTPACLLARWSGIDLQPEAGAGWVSRTHHFIVAPACAGMNFFIVCFLSLYFSFQARFEHGPRKAAWLVASFFAAYAVTIAVNAVRIVLSVHLRDDLQIVQIDPERAHRVLGVAVFLGGLLAAHFTAEKILGAGNRALPILLYFSVAALLPLGLHLWSFGLHMQNVQMLEHLSTLTAASALALVFLFLSRRQTRGKLNP